jgi:signal transduction histidine kinase
MAHEITQPLNAVSFSVENIRSRFGSGALDAEYLKAKIAAIESDIDRVRRVIEHVRLFARGAPDGYRVSFQANRCVENAMALIGVQLATHGIDVSLALADGLPDMNGNPFQYEQVLLNLLSNARDAVEERKVRDAEADLADPLPGRIRISTSLAADQVLLEVEDNGIGIPPGIEDRVFDPFFTTKAPGKGTGLGLSLSYGIIREMGGRILLERRTAGAAARVLVPVESKA